MAPIVVEASPAAEVRFQGLNYEMTLFQTRSPVVTLPDGVDLSQLGKAALRLLGMEPAAAEAASRQIDWNSTLIFPFPADTNNIRQLTIGDTSGLLVVAKTDAAHRRRRQVAARQRQLHHLVQGEKPVIRGRRLARRRQGKCSK